jgi:hypothetical protein
MGTALSDALGAVYGDARKFDQLSRTASFGEAASLVV